MPRARWRCPRRRRRWGRGCSAPVASSDSRGPGSRSSDDSGSMPLRSLSRTPSSSAIAARSRVRSPGGANSTSAIIAASSCDGSTTGAVSKRSRTARRAAAVIGSWHPASLIWLPIAHAYAVAGRLHATAITARLQRLARDCDRHRMHSCGMRSRRAGSTPPSDEDPARGLPGCAVVRRRTARRSLGGSATASSGRAECTQDARSCRP